MPTGNPRPMPGRRVPWTNLQHVLEEDRVVYNEWLDSYTHPKRTHSEAPGAESSQLDKSLPKGAIRTRSSSSVISSYHGIAILNSRDQDVLRHGKTVATDNIVTWAILEWLDTLMATQTLGDIFVFHPSFWMDIQSFPFRYEKRLQDASFFDRKIGVFPIHLKENSHWIAAAIINPGSIFKPVEELDTFSYPVIVVADSLRVSSFEWEMFQRLRLWLFDFAFHMHPTRDVKTPARFAHLRVPRQQYGYECGYHMLHNMRQIYDNYQEILHLLPWEFETDIMNLDNLEDELFQRIWRPDSVLLRKVALQRQLMTYVEIDSVLKLKNPPVFL